ncbi:MAG: FAD-dependent oxidoreductase [Ferruginibacter sp.]|nr:FAD-dependent oxidoreductase [Ferruginibacter sp.]
MTPTIHTDVVIVGGGAAGVAAAVAASNKGLKVVLIEQHSFLGGKATAAEVGTVCGLYKFSKQAQAEYIVKGFAKDFGEDLRKRSNTAPLSSSGGLHYLPYDTGAFKSLCTDLLISNKVEVYFGSILKNVQINSNCVESISIQTGNQTRAIIVKSIIDCSGESTVSGAAGLPVITSENYQAAAQVFTLQNIGQVTEASLGMILKRELQSAIDEKKLEDYYDRVYIVQGSLKNGCVTLKIGIPVAVTHAPDNLQALKTSAHLFVHTLTGYLIQHVPVFKHASLMGIAPEIGIRVSARSCGKYILTEDDVLNCKKNGAAIANASWPIEEWEQNKRVKMRYFRLDDFYQVPAGCLQSATIKNLYMGGRNISATDSAIASARVMGICLQTGYAAGLLAAGHVLNISEKEIIKIIQSAQL